MGIFACRRGVSIYVYIYIYTCTYICMYVQKHTYEQLLACCFYIQVCKYMFVQLCVYVHTRTCAPQPAELNTWPPL